MAVVQISRIQIRRGRKNSGSGIPQLAGGELGWAVDSQELYIGNGSVSEGSPAVGNTKVLTENDNLSLGLRYDNFEKKIERIKNGFNFLPAPTPYTDSISQKNNFDSFSPSLDWERKIT